MPFKFNPFTGNFDQNGSGGGGGASYIDGEVATYADLPLDGTAAINSAWLVREASGTWLLGRKPAGIYIRTATAGVSRDADYTYAGILPDVFSDANFTLYDDADSTKNAKFQLSGITTGTTRTLTVPDASGTIALDGHTHDASDVTSGTLDTARLGSGTASSSSWLRGDSTWQALPAVDLSSAPPIGSTAPNTGAFTTLSSNSSASICGMTIRSTSHPSAGHFDFLVYEGYSGIARFDSILTDFIAIGPTRGIAWSSSTSNAGTSKDTGIYRDGSAGIIGQRYGTTAQEYRIYGTYTSSTNFQRMTVKSVKQTLSALSGASATTTGTFIPDGAVVVGVTTRVATAITGASGYTIGDGTDADRWGDITGTAIGTTSDNRDWTAGTIECFTAGKEITVTAKTSNFTAGAIEICLFYIAGEAD